jgi:hypothetical protein
VRPFAAAVIAALARRPSRNRNSCATTKNAGWPPSDGVSATRDCPSAPWHARHQASRSSIGAATAADASTASPNAATTATRIEDGRAALDPERAVNASS